MAVTTEMFMLSVISLMAMVMSLMQARLAGTDAGLKPTVFLYAVLPLLSEAVVTTIFPDSNKKVPHPDLKQNRVAPLLCDYDRHVCRKRKRRSLFNDWILFRFPLVIKKRNFAVFRYFRLPPSGGDGNGRYLMENGSTG
jgi:hypothetical protein